MAEIQSITEPGSASKKTEALHVTGSQTLLLLSLCDGLRPKDRGRARQYGRVFAWASQGPWGDWDEWPNEEGAKTVPPAILEAPRVLDADKKTQRAITALINDALSEGVLPGVSLRKLDKLYRQIEGDSLTSED